MKEKIENDIETVGEMLKNTRLKSGKTLSDVADDLCIRKVYLTAIEEMDFDNIPEMPYGLGFIRTYAQYLGLNSDRIVASYRQLDAENNSGKLSDEDEQTSVSKPSFRHIFLSIIGIVAIVGSGIMFSMHKQYENIDDQQTEEFVAENDSMDKVTEFDAVLEDEDETLIVKEETTSEENMDDAISEAMEAEFENEVAAQDDTVAEAITKKLRLVLTGPSWIELKQGDKVVLQGIYNKDFSYDIANVADTYITVGRHYYAQFYLDDEPIKIVSAMKKKNVKLDEYLNPQE